MRGTRSWRIIEVEGREVTADAAETLQSFEVTVPRQDQAPAALTACRDLAAAGDTRPSACPSSGSTHLVPRPAGCRPVTRRPPAPSAPCVGPVTDAASVKAAPRDATRAVPPRHPHRTTPRSRRVTHTLRLSALGMAQLRWAAELREEQQPSAASDPTCRARTARCSPGAGTGGPGADRKARWVGCRPGRAQLGGLACSAAHGWRMRRGVRTAHRSTRPRRVYAQRPCPLGLGGPAAPFTWPGTIIMIVAAAGH